jgi:hypothetical protein
MKVKMCDNNLLCFFLGVLLLIVLWYVIYGRKKIESFNGITDPLQDLSNTSNYNMGPIDYPNVDPVIDSPGYMTDSGAGGDTFQRVI